MWPGSGALGSPGAHGAVVPASRLVPEPHSTGKVWIQMIKRMFSGEPGGHPGQGETEAYDDPEDVGGAFGKRRVVCCLDSGEGRGDMEGKAACEVLCTRARWRGSGQVEV